MLRTDLRTTVARVTAFIAYDASAMSYQSLGQYRAALSKMLNEVKANK